jgi:putative transposase
MLSVATDAQAHDGLRLDLDELVREGARRMLAAALEAEVDDYLAAHAGERDEGGRRLVVGNGHAHQRLVTTAAGAVAVRAPRVDDRRTDLVTGERLRFRSVILPPWCRTSPKVAEVLPLLYLHGLSTGDFAPALAAFFGSAAGLSAAAIGRLLAGWQADDQAFCQRDLAGRDYVYRWADGLHFRVRLSRPTCAVWCWWACVPTDQGTGRGRRRGTGVDRVVGGAAAGSASPGDARPGGGGRRRRAGAVGRLRDVFPATRQQRDWVHKLTGVLNALPNSVHAGARKALAEIRDAPDRDHAERAIELFAGDYGVKWPKAVAKITNDAEALLTFYDFPAEHWVHLKTSNPIESTFATVRLRTWVTKGPGSKAAGLAMAFKLLEAAQDRWRAVNGRHLVALVRAGHDSTRG